MTIVPPRRTQGTWKKQKKKENEFDDILFEKCKRRKIGKDCERVELVRETNWEKE